MTEYRGVTTRCEVKEFLGWGIEYEMDIVQ